MKKIIITISLLFPIIIFCQDIGKTNDLRDSFVGTYECTGLPWVPGVIHTWPIMYVRVEKHPTDSIKLLIEDSTRNGDGPSMYSHIVNFYYVDSSYYKSQDYYGDFKKQDSIHMINVVPGVGGYNIYCPKVQATAIGKIFAETTYQVFPNPFINELYILTPFPKNKNIEAALYDVQGRCVHKETYKADTNTYILYLQGLQTGVYILRLTNNKERFYKKVVKGI